MAGLIISTIPLLAYAAPQVNGADEVVVALRSSGRVIRLVGPRGMWQALAHDLLGFKREPASGREPPPAPRAAPPAPPIPPGRLAAYRRVVAAVRAGATWEQACFAECVKPNTVMHWLSRTEPKISPGAEAPQSKIENPKSKIITTP
jgi:hypothetical protein